MAVRAAFVMKLNVQWPLPALLCWGAAWALYLAVPAHRIAAFGLASGLSLALALVLAATRWRRLFIAAGFPLSLAMSGGTAGLPAWAWLIPLLLLAALYPPNVWRDAPLFPTSHGALDELAAAAPLPAGARILDAGCGLGAGLQELRRAYPQAQLVGIERSWPLAWLCRLRCRRIARVHRGDIWADDWSGYRMVYLFQRPESMERAWEKARRELRPGSWLVSLEFEVSGVRAQQRLDGNEGRQVWLYRSA